MWESETRAQKEAGLLQGLAALDIQLSLSCPLPNRRRVEALGPSAPLSELLVPAGSKGLERGSPATLTRFCTATLYRERLRAGSALPGKGEDTQGRRPCEDRGRAQSEASTSHGCPGWPGAHRSPESRKEHPLEPPEGARPCRLLGFGLLSRLCRCVVDLTKTVLSCDRFRMEQAEHQRELQE